MNKQTSSNLQDNGTISEVSLDTSKQNILDLLEKMNHSYKLKIIRPGGNETVLIDGIIEDPEIRKEINSSIMNAFSNKEDGTEMVEQVGFVSYDKEYPRLMMAGGEFCGNATRSFAWDFLNGTPGIIDVQVSGVQNKLKAGVKENGDARSQMPIYKSFEKIYPSKLDKNAMIVEMEGITHLVTTSEIPFSKNDSNFSQKIKEYAFQILKDNNLTDFPAAGVMFLADDGKGGYNMTPIVYVKSIDTLFLEGACGSGTTAVGLLLAKDRGDDIIDYPIVQYSGVPIDITVRLNECKNGFEYADISGPVNKIFEGKLRTDLKNNVVIQNNIDEDSLRRALQEGKLSQLYQELFGEAPYFEKFTDNEVEEIFNEYKNNGELYLAISELKTVGFGASMPFNLSSIKDVPGLKEELELSGVDLGKCVYMADLGVSKKHQRKGIGEQLVNARIEGQPDGTTIIMRTSVENQKSQGIYRKWNFKELKTRQFVEMERISGLGKDVDERLFLVTTK